MCNSEEERQRYLELAVKEANIERAVREKVSITLCFEATKVHRGSQNLQI